MNCSMLNDHNDDDGYHLSTRLFFFLRHISIFYFLWDYINEVVVVTTYIIMLLCESPPPVF